jgi:hypothetical protein
MKKILLLLLSSVTFISCCTTKPQRKQRKLRHDPVVINEVNQTIQQLIKDSVIIVNP